MKKFLKPFVALLGLCMLSACDETLDQNQAALSEISPNYIYFFYQNSCPHCHYASEYISKKYPSLQMVNMDVRDPKNFNLFLKCANKFNLDRNALGTPLICMGSHYIMGWDDTDRVKFDSYVQKFR